MKIVFRSDASIEIATGHVMRCLALATALRLRGHNCKFICRDLPGHMGQIIRDYGFELILLPIPNATFTPTNDEPIHAAWAGVSWSVDAKESKKFIQGSDWLVLDHYSFDIRWQTHVRSIGLKIMVIDDLADRPHAADLLVDQNLGRQSSDYDSLLPENTERLIGPRYALLRKEFADARKIALASRTKRKGTLKNILISMGGVDAQNTTAATLDVIASQTGFQVTVVIGSSSPNLEKIHRQAASITPPAKIVERTTDMAALMTKADIAIGAAGGTAWERCALGLPSLVAILAENQAMASEALSASGAAIELGSPQSSKFVYRLSEALKSLKIPENLVAMSNSAAALVDGCGASRVINRLERYLILRQSTLDDAETIWLWRSALPKTSFVKGGSFTLEDHLKWFSLALMDPKRRLYTSGDPQIAHLRLDITDTGPAWISIIIAPAARGQGVGNRLLSRLTEIARAEGIPELYAKVHIKNCSSIELFRASGYLQTYRDGEFQIFSLKI